MSDANFKSKTLFTSDNLYILRGMNSECVDLIYLDPPFNSKKNYAAPLPIKDEEILASFKDVWKLIDIDEALHEELRDTQPCLYEIIKGTETAHSKGMFSYLIYMTMRLVEMYRVLKPTGSIYLHCDPTASHYLKIVMDCIFGEKNFINEVVWTYTGGTDKKKGFLKKHDTILFYSKSDDFTFNPIFVPFAHATVKRFNKVAKDGRRYKINKLSDGRITKTYMKTEGKLSPDYWHFNIIVKSHSESTGYRTQKPLALLERIIKASSNEGDLVLDPFCGCATAMIAAEKLNRKWVGIDVSPFARYFVRYRIEKELEKKITPIFLNEISGRSCINKEELKSWELKKKMYDEQRKKCNGCKSFYHQKDLTVDHIIPTVKGGQDTEDNKQLLCFHCNVTKGTGSMKSLWNKLKKAGILEEHEIN